IKDVRDAANPPSLSENTDDNIDEQNDDQEDVDTEAKSGVVVASTKKSDKKDKDEDESDEDILKRMRKRFDRCVSNEAENRKAELEDLKFKAGDQWPADVATQRNTD